MAPRVQTFFIELVLLVQFLLHVCPSLKGALLAVWEPLCAWAVSHLVCCVENMQPAVHELLFGGPSFKETFLATWALLCAVSTTVWNFACRWRQNTALPAVVPRKRAPPPTFDQAYLDRIAKFEAEYPALKEARRAAELAAQVAAEATVDPKSAQKQKKPRAVTRLAAKLGCKARAGLCRLFGRTQSEPSAVVP
eukprot:comp21410_c0_seq1/m.29501 comp21410_c0_seq1/g.29501  ORF comp21410_c0_seq1/g.29501 comp21410_c0_seq1/m.29501 type:complete len:194 (-) comp21410_c0_seq1:648-1229(-)